MESTCKETSVKLYGKGAFGNCLRQWDTLTELDADNFTYPIVIRYRHPQGGGGPCYYHMHRSDVQTTLDKIASAGWNLDYVYYNEGAPDDHAILQGELCEFDNGRMSLLYNTMSTQMRTALTHHTATSYSFVSRLSIMDLIQRHMTPSSYEDCKILLELYTNHAIEFTIYDCLVGILRGRNTIIWDVRRY